MTGVPSLARVGAHAPGEAMDGHMDTLPEVACLHVMQCALAWQRAIGQHPHAAVLRGPHPAEFGGDVLLHSVHHLDDPGVRAMGVGHAIECLCQVADLEALEQLGIPTSMGTKAVHPPEPGMGHIEVPTMQAF